MLDLTTLPIEARTLIEAQAATIARQDAELTAHRAMVETLRVQLARLRRMQFGRSSEKLDAEIAQLAHLIEMQRSAQHPPLSAGAHLRKHIRATVRLDRSPPAGLRKRRHRGLALVGCLFTLPAAASKPVRAPKLVESVS